MSRASALFVVALVAACSSTSSAEKSGGFEITISGEDLAVNGYPFAVGADVDTDPPPLVDGWQLEFRHVIVTVGNIELHAEPDRDPANPRDVGELVARVDGPFAVDLKIGGPLVGKSGAPDEKAILLATVSERADGKAFDPAARYAFGYDTLPASAAAKPLNLDAEGAALYETAKSRGWAMIFDGVATYRGPAVDAGSVFETIPSVVSFTLGMRNPSSYLNCQNTDLSQLPSGEFPRGIQADPARPVVAQITLHTDHAFWRKLNVEGTELHFDPIAAQADANGRVTMDDLATADVTGFKTRAGQSLPGRSLVSGYAAPAGQLRYDPNGTTFSRVNGFAAYLQYSAAAGGHLNTDGPCEVRNNFVP